MSEYKLVFMELVKTLFIYLKVYIFKHSLGLELMTPVKSWILFCLSQPGAPTSYI